jgi:hypothetical protein
MGDISQARRAVDHIDLKVCSPLDYGFARARFAFIPDRPGACCWTAAPGTRLRTCITFDQC